MALKNGYSSQLMVYVGSDEYYDDDGLGANVVLKLTDPLRDRGHIVYSDRFFTSLILAEKLLSKRTFITGTIKPNRLGYPSKLIKNVSKRGDISWVMKKNGILAGNNFILLI